MFLSEPPRTAYDLNFRLGDVPVRVHPLFWLVAIIMGSQLKDPKLVLIWIAVIFFSILIHELGHVLAFRYYGISAHVVLHSMGGLAIPGHSYQQYGQTRRSDSGLARMVISLAGPAAGFVLAALVVVVLLLVNRSVDFGVFGYNLAQLGRGPHLLSPESGVPIELYFAVDSLLFVNILWGMVNLLPIYPLDGGQVSRELFLRYNPSQGVHHSLMLSMIVAIAFAAFGLKERDWFIAIFFGFFAYQSYQMMQMNRGPGGGYGGRGW